MKCGAHPSRFATLSFHDSKKLPIYCWVDWESFLVALTTRPPSFSNLFSGDVHGGYGLDCGIRILIFYLPHLYKMSSLLVKSTIRFRYIFVSIASNVCCNINCFQLCY